MRVFQPTYKDRNGQTQTAAKWYVEFADHRGKQLRLAGYTDRRQTEALGRRIADLVGLKAGAQTLPPDMTKWIESLPPRLQRLLGKWGLLDAGKVAALRTLAEHLNGAPEAPGYRQYLEAKGNTAKHVELVCARAAAVSAGCKFLYWSDVSASAVMAYLSGLRAATVKTDAEGQPRVDKDGKPITRPGKSAQTFRPPSRAFAVGWSRTAGPVNRPWRTLTA